MRRLYLVGVSPQLAAESFRPPSADRALVTLRLMLRLVGSGQPVPPVLLSAATATTTVSKVGSSRPRSSTTCAGVA